MQPFHHPETIRLVHEARVSDEMHRNGSRSGRAVYRPGPRPRDGIRTGIGRALIALGPRIAPAHQHLERPVPASR